MKIATLVTVLALASGGALAAQSSSGYADQNAATTQHSTATSKDTQSNGGFIDRTKRALHRLGDKMRNAGHKSRTENEASRSDTRSMGASGSTDQDSARQHRMDQAYADWQSKQKK